MFDFVLKGGNASQLEKDIGSDQFPANEHFFGLVNVSTSSSTFKTRPVPVCTFFKMVNNKGQTLCSQINVQKFQGHGTCKKTLIMAKRSLTNQAYSMKHQYQPKTARSTLFIYLSFIHKTWRRYFRVLKYIVILNTKSFPLIKWMCWLRAIPKSIYSISEDGVMTNHSMLWAACGWHIKNF